MAQNQEWVNVQIKARFVLPVLTYKYILEKMEELAVHPEKFLELKNKREGARFIQFGTDIA